jgi:hypothetical protein
MAGEQNKKSELYGEDDEIVLSARDVTVAFGDKVIQQDL